MRICLGSYSSYSASPCLSRERSDFADDDPTHHGLSRHYHPTARPAPLRHSFNRDVTYKPELEICHWYNYPELISGMGGSAGNRSISALGLCPHRSRGPTNDVIECRYPRPPLCSPQAESLPIAVAFFHGLVARVRDHCPNPGMRSTLDHFVAGWKIVPFTETRTRTLLHPRSRSNRFVRII